MSESRVLTAVEGGVATLTLNRPAKRNAIDRPTLEALDAAVAALAADPAARVVVLRGAGPMFSAGIDLSALSDLAAPDGVSLRRLIGRIQGILGAVAVLEKPVVAALHGACLGLGLELALAADLRIAEAGTRLALPELVLGLIPDCGGTTRLSRLVGTARAKRLIFTGDGVDAEEALAIGLVDEVAPAGGLDAAVARLAETLTRRSPVALSMAKRVIDAAHDTSRGQQLELERVAQTIVVSAPDFGEWLQRGMAELLTRKR
jgi:enoyl-CoA hydratase/carnithine racemase